MAENLFFLPNRNSNIKLQQSQYNIIHINDFLLHNFSLPYHKKQLVFFYQVTLSYNKMEMVLMVSVYKISYLIWHYQMLYGDH